ncbi:MAG: zeta toxin family protein [Rhodospirillaceae bacterium]|nr:zeta toxin family protein [Rhodospirillaceae bacterium]
MSSVSGERPIFWIFAGPNGSGKSTLYKDANITLHDGSIWIINPDVLAARINKIERLSYAEANIEAVVRIESWLEASIKAHQTVGVETVLSTPKYRRLVLEAKKRDFEVRLAYVLLENVEMNIARVALRVKKGGHNVPEQKIRERYTRSLAQLPWFLSQADRATLFDNSGELPERIGEKSGGTITLNPSHLPVIAKVIEQLKSERFE